MCSLDQHFLQRNENIALLKAQKAKTVASGFKVTVLVNFLVCFADPKEKDLIECYCLRISINNHKNLPVVIFFFLLAKTCRLRPRTRIVTVIDRERENHGGTGLKTGWGRGSVRARVCMGGVLVRALLWAWITSVKTSGLREKSPGVKFLKD